MFCLVAEKVGINLVLQLADFNNPLTDQSQHTTQDCIFYSQNHNEGVTNTIR